MTNTEIIIAEAVKNGIYTEDKIENFLAKGVAPPIHTYAFWEQNGYRVKKGQHACITTRLWQLEPPKKTDDGDETEEHFYLTKAHLFSLEQVERYMEVAE